MSEQDQNQVGRSAEVNELGEMLQFQEGSIVSRVLLKNKGGSVTLFAFDEGEGLSEHTAPFDALVLVIDGEADIEIAGAGYRVRQGETITLPAERPHAVRAATRFKMLLIMIRAQ
jgi:quercetin dioxygenase-like cupin family protein